MSGSAPVVSLALDQTTPYPQGGQLVATATVSDPDTRTEIVATGPDPDGVPTTVTAVHVDTAAYSWSWEATGALLGFGATLTIAVPAVSDTLVCTVADAEGNTGTATVAVSVLQPMLVGATYLTSDAATHAKLFPGNAYYRGVYTPQTKGLYGWTSAAVKAVPPGALMHESFKDTPTAALLAPWYAAIPPGVTDVWLTVHHEPEGDLPPATYDVDWAFMRTFRDSQPNGHKVKLVQVLTGYAETHGKGPWQGWITDDCDVIAVDTYRNEFAGDTYPDPSVVFALPIAISRATGKPWAISEFGGDRISTDTTGSGRAAWMTACVKYARSNGCIAIAWFCEPGTTSKAVNGYHLDACAPELAAWKAAISGQ